MRLAFALVLIAVLASIACGNVIARKYEYEEEIFLALDGSATVYVNASVPALVALRGVALPLDPRARLDRTVVRDLYETPVSQRRQRHDVAPRRPPLRAPAHRPCPTSAGSARRRRLRGQPIAIASRTGTFEFAQTMRRRPAKRWATSDGTASELMAVRLHLPSKVTFHNSPSRRIERGNIVVWEQPLAERSKGTPLEVQARMETESILFRTLALFGAMGVLVVLTFIAAIWFVRSRKPA